MSHRETEGRAAPLGRIDRIRQALSHTAHYLPKQAPLEVFVHHNTLHAFEDRPFFVALADAEKRLGVRTLLPEKVYREAHKCGRITEAEVRWAIAQSGLAKQPENWPQPFPGTETLAYLMMRHSLRETTEPGISWMLHETDAERCLRRDVPGAARKKLLSLSASETQSSLPDHEARVVKALWQACVALVDRCQMPTPLPPAPQFFRALLRQLTGQDPCDVVHQMLIPLLAAFLDRGEAQWQMPNRLRGLYLVFEELMTAGLVLRPAWSRQLGLRIRSHLRDGFDAEQEVLSLLDELGIADEDIEEYVTHNLLHLPGWAGMFARLEQSTDPVLSGKATVRLIDFLAVRLELDAMAFLDLARRHGFSGKLRELLPWLRAQAPQTAPTAEKGPSAWALFQLSQVAGLRPQDLHALSPTEAQLVLDFFLRFSQKTRLPLWQRAYERHYRDELLSALWAKRAAKSDAGQTSARPKMQVVCCIDDREESLRRHIETASPHLETFGTAGFFNLAIAYQGIDDPTTFPLCPVVITPKHLVVEEPLAGQTGQFVRRKVRQVRWYKLLRTYKRASRSLFWGPVVTALAGLWAAVPLLLTVFAPGLAARLRQKLRDNLLPPVKTQLSMRRDDTSRESGLLEGFSIAEKAERVAHLLENIGLTRNFGQLVVLVGHDSHSVNNPHFAAYACGACGGRSGGPNARLFARMANRPEVRSLLRARGLEIPDDTYFLGAVHDTCDDEIHFFDDDRLPETHRPLFAEQQRLLAWAVAQNSQERARRFETAPLTISAEQAHEHVQERGADLSQARPELGHATNASAVIGRRSVSEGLFLDRRSFLVSYDPTTDPTGDILERTLVAVLPVGAGINLEYFFSTVDNERLGAGTKLPHNVTGLVGVMNGACSDLRTGLPLQMVEIHEPLRLLIVIECRPAVLLSVLTRQKNAANLLRNEWLFVCVIDPDTGQFFEFDPERGLISWRPVDQRPDSIRTVRAWRDAYVGQRSSVPPALLAMQAEPFLATQTGGTP